MLDWINAHGLVALIGYWVFSSGVGALPTPASTSSGFYQWAYKFLHGLLQLAAANSTRIPQVRNLLGITSDTPEKKDG